MTRHPPRAICHGVYGSFIIRTRACVFPFIYLRAQKQISDGRLCAANNIKIFIARRLIEWAMAVRDAFAPSARLVGGTQVPPGSPDECVGTTYAHLMPVLTTVQ